jgi:hypothetical protein
MMNVSKMDISPATKSFLEEIDAFSHGRLTQRDAVLILLELARLHEQQARIDRIAFLAKFLSNAYGILQRPTSDPEGRAKLAREFQENLEKVTGELKELITRAPDDARQRFSATFLTQSTESFGNLLKLLYDLSWLKNLGIDKKSSS